MQSPQSPSSPQARSRASSRASHLTLDLSNIPPLIKPTQPTNTLLITNIQNLETFHPVNLQTLRDTINAAAPIVNWSPLKSFRRILVVFPSPQEALDVRKALDGEIILGDELKIYFGENTPVEPVDQHLAAPESKKLFFISPPPSPPHGWEVRDEEPPNTVVVAEDLAHALARLATKRPPPVFQEAPTQTPEPTNEAEKSEAEDTMGKGPVSAVQNKDRATVGRSRSSSILLFEPEKKDENKMPAISVDDYSDGETAPTTPVGTESPVKIVPPHTARPPVELMTEN
ncbi:Calcipressin [Ascobolus immersus RN42]|uniref:Calcipressin n=1 Tax=Ascobolus immersus RN42 TaxID=1160509 RepID=A0A3N4ILB2_ASCIM|nr:Calcipressin [Ascobolus immersus RN42]